MLGRLRFVTPELKLNIVTIVDCKFFCRTALCRAGDERKIVVQKLRFIPSSPNIAKPFVVRSLFFQSLPISVIQYFQLVFEVG